MVSATEEHQWVPLPRVARHYFTDDDRVVAALMYFGHLAIKPRERVLKHRATGHLNAMVQLLETVGVVSQGKAARQPLMRPSQD